MKTLLLTLVLTINSSFAMTNIPEGSYKGSASWKDSKSNQGRYNVSIDVENGAISSTYDYGGKPVVYQFSTVHGQEGFFEVKVEGKVVGSGYCMNVQCHYSATFGVTELEETLTYWQGNLYRVGSKTTNGHTIAWEEATKKLD